MPAVKLAPRLLGTRLVRILADGTRLSGIIVEVEAYCGPKDLGSHARGGRRTPRNEAMYAQPGTAYVYFTYGMHFCMNIVCGEVDVPLAVLLRALEPVEGIERMRELRGPLSSGRPRPETDLCSGPGKLCQALAIDHRLNHVDLVTGHGAFLEPMLNKPKGRTLRTARIGLNTAGDWTHKPLRWLLSGNLHVSPARPPIPKDSPAPAPPSKARRVRTGQQRKVR
ncbi:MAG: DNA-3-methyladenine glycosylase [Phycisphaerales bacterium]|nr:DNA-3-methyladenine glycosylase [Phycisphaerales bacterium]